MSRSYKKNKGFGWTNANSDAIYKTQEHRRFRRYCKQQVKIGEWETGYLAKLFGTPYNSPKDGKQWWKGASKADMRK